jgi:hypothetical protein
VTVSAATLLLAAGGHLDNRVRIAAVIVTAIMLGVVLELVRRRRLVERYALVWMLVTVALLVLAIWNQLLSRAADLLGIAVPSNALFLAAFAVAFLLLLHFSVITTRLSEETKILAQEVARLDGEIRAGREAGSNGDGAGSPPEATQSALADRDPPTSASTADQ